MTDAATRKQMAERGALRRDAQERRDRIVRAADELFAAEGFDVSLDKIADSANVGRATLQRNFPEREDLYAAVLEIHVERLATTVAKWANRDDAFFLALQSLATKGVSSSGFEKLIPLHLRAPIFTDGFRRSIEAILAPPLARAKAAGLVRKDFKISEVHCAILMITGGSLSGYGEDTEECMQQALRMLRRGVSP